MPTASVLITAYACRPDGDRESVAAWEWCRAAAARHDVWLLTTAGSAAHIAAELARQPVPSLTVVPVEPPTSLWHHAIWSRLASRAARRLDAEHNFDVIHHLAADTDRRPIGLVRRSGARVIWGPAAATSPAPPALAKWLGAGGLIAELVRRAVTAPLHALTVRRLAKHVNLVVARDNDAAWAYRRAGQVVVHPAVTIRRQLSGGHQERLAPPGVRTALFVGRLIPSRGLLLAIATLSHPAADGWELRVIGDGPEWFRADRMADRLGVRDRVEFLGSLPRREVLAAMSRSDGLLAPTIGGSPGWAVAEALASGCPVVCLDRGAPAVLVGPGEGAVVPSRGDITAALAEGLAGLSGRIEPVDRWAPDRLPDVLADWYAGSVVPRG
jgi:glycosyltransferase involved in cell wall biosynthesis